MGERLQSRSPKYGKRAELPFLDLWHGRHRRDDGNRRMAPDRRTDRLACAAEGHMHQIDSIRYTQLRAHEMPW